MKYKLFSALIAVGVLIGFSHMNKYKRVPASVKDVGVIGPDAKVILYYKNGDYIIVKACDPNTILGMTPTQARSNCLGKSNKVPIESFKQSLRNLVSTDRLNVLKPLTAEEVEVYNEDGPNSDQIEAMVIELEKINNFIAAYGAENANLVRKEELEKALRSQETRVSVIKKINAEVEKAVNLIADQTKLTLTNFNSDKDQFLYTVLKQFNPNQKFPCGLKGTVDERIKDCSYQLTSETEGFVLVTRTKDFYEVHKETSTGLLWSDRLPNTMNYYAAEKACNSGSKEFVGIPGVTWRLPSIDDYQEAEKSGIRRALPNMNYWFWVSGVSAHRILPFSGWPFNNYTFEAWLYGGYYGNWQRDRAITADYSVRCVSR